MNNLPKDTEVKITLPNGETYDAIALDIGTFGHDEPERFGLIKWMENDGKA